MNKSAQLKELVLQTLDDQKANNIVEIDLTTKSDICDFIIIASGTSSRHLFSIKEKIQEAIKKNGYKKFSSEGEDSLNWVVIDLEDIIIHLFKPEVRDYYQIEEIWTANHNEN